MRNANGRFSEVPSANIKRSSFDRSFSHKTSFNVGELVPIFVDEVLPGDTFSVDTSKVVRLQTPITPVMDNLFLDTYFFFVPARLCWEHWKEFMGENSTSAWISDITYSVPQTTAPAGGWQIGTIADYMGIPTGVGGISVNSLPFRAYTLIVNEWFRDQNLQDPAKVSLDDATDTGSNGSNYITDLELGGMPFVASKLHDYFTSALPAPQKGPDVTIPLLGSNLPVYAMDENTPTPSALNQVLLRSEYNYPSTTNFDFFPTFNTGEKTADDSYHIYGSSGFFTTNEGRPTDNGLYKVAGGGQTTTDFANLWAVTSGTAMASINQLRLAFQTQKYFEKLARGGSRYTEMIKSMFGVTNPDYRMQRPEYLGGNRIPITMSQVVQQSQTTESSPQGTVAAVSLTTDSHSDFTKSFTEHGYIIGLCVARYQHTYQQGLNRLWSRKSTLDFYFPVFANIGETPILNKEIYAQGTAEDDEVFGYQEAWAEYRYRPNMVSSEMRSAAPQSLDIWHYADEYSTLPALSPDWIREEKSNVDRTLAVQSTLSKQLFADLYFKMRCTRPMPVFSVPGLIDHH